MPQSLRRVSCAAFGVASANGVEMRPMKATFVRKAGCPARAAHLRRPSSTWNSSIAAIPGPTAAAEGAPIWFLLAQQLRSRFALFRLGPRFYHFHWRDHATYSPFAFASSPCAGCQLRLFLLGRAGEIFQTRF